MLRYAQSEVGPRNDKHLDWETSRKAGWRAAATGCDILTGTQNQLLVTLHRCCMQNPPGHRASMRCTLHGTFTGSQWVSTPGSRDQAVGADRSMVCTALQTMHISGAGTNSWCACCRPGGRCNDGGGGNGGRRRRLRPCWHPDGPLTASLHAASGQRR